MIKVIGIGSPFGDDKLGSQCIDILKSRGLLKDYIPHALSLENYDRPGVRLLEIMSTAKNVFLIDAVVAGNPVGTIYCFQNEKIEEMRGLISTHDFGIAKTLELGRSLNMLPANIIFYGIEIENAGPFSEISPLVKSAIDELVECIETEVFKWL